MLGAHNLAKAFVKIAPVDFRKGIDSLVAYVEQGMGLQTRSGAAFIFTNRQKTSIKILYYDGTGYFLCHKRFSSGRMRNWPRQHDTTGQLELNMRQLMVLIFDGDLQTVNFKEDFQKVG
jgi:transposase